MIATDLQREMHMIEVQTRRSYGLSIIAHLLLFLSLSLWKVVAPEPIGITEITWIDPVVEKPVETPIVAKVEPIAVATPKTAARILSRISEKFRRTEEVADVAPAPQTLKRVDSRMSDRLAALQETSRPTPKPIVAVKTPSPVGRPKLAGAPDLPAPSQPTDLKRAAVPSTPSPVTLKRSKPPRVEKASVMTAMPDLHVDRAQPDDVEATARRTVAGMQMTGPVADRKIVSYDTPVYPEWAKREGVEGSVLVYFVVLADGSVKENVMVQKTSGFSEFDENAVNAILSWRFEPLRNGQTGEQWGTIMFNYRLE